MPKKLMAGTPQDAVSQMWARALVQREMQNRGLSYADLTARLNALGITDNERNVRNKVARGTFSAGFFLTALRAIECHILNLSIGVPGGDIEHFLRDPVGVVGPGYGVAIMTYPTIDLVLQQQKEQALQRDRDNDPKPGAGDATENASPELRTSGSGEEKPPD